MISKCKFCGYRFKDRDERICPECFTAREGDISCSQFSDDLHSHEIFDDRYSRNDYSSPENDTFKEERMSFAEEERREEQKSKFSKIEQMHKSQPERTEFIPKSGDGVYNKTNGMPYNNNIPIGNFTRQNGNQFQRTPTGFIPPAYNRNNVKNNTGCAVVAIIIFVVVVLINIFMAFSDVSKSKYNDYDYDDNNYDNEIIYENNNFSNYTTETQYSSYKDYYLDQDYYNAYYYDSTYLSEGDYSHLILGDNSYDDSESGQITYFVDEPIYNIYTSYSLVVKEGSEGSITSVVCEGRTYSGEILSTYTAPEYQLIQNGDIFDDELIITPVLICSGKAEIIDITVTVNYDGQEEKFTYRLDVDSEE